MANLPEPDWLTLFESAEQARRAFDAEQSTVEAALIHAFHDGKIRARGRCRSFFGHNMLHDLARYTWDMADVIWHDNEFAITDDRVGREIHIFSDVVVYREDLEEWINGATPDSQHGPQEAVEIAVPEDEPVPPRKKPAESRHKRWMERAKELKRLNPDIETSAIASKLRREDLDFNKQTMRSNDPDEPRVIRDTATIRRVLTNRRKEWELPQ